MYNLRHKRDRFLLADRKGVLVFTTLDGAARYLNRHGYAGQYDTIPVEDAQ